MRFNEKMSATGFALLSVLLVLSVVTEGRANASYLLWQGEVRSWGGDVLTSPLLESGVRYYIVAEGVFWYDFIMNLTADAQYYTTMDQVWLWGNHFRAPFDHSFLQIDGHDVDWGPFSNGDTGHRYTIIYIGEGAAIKFTIVDWVDNDDNNNVSHFYIKIYVEPPVGGFLVESYLSVKPELMTIGTVISAFVYVAIKMRR